jgi:hypothetical protein
MEFQQTQYALDVLIKRIRTGRLALPNFQREFVWGPSEVVELLDSVARRWPIGSLLLLKGPQPFAFRSVEAGPLLDSRGLDLYILDGQQRVTALFHAIADVSDFTYYVDFRKLSDDEEPLLRWERRSRFQRLYPTAAARAANRLALVRELWDNTGFYEWLRNVPDEAERASVIRLREQKLKGLQDATYKVMAIELDQSIELEALARIFETLNRTGVALNAFDLMVAAMYPLGFELRAQWEAAIESNPELARFETNEFEVLRVIALLIRIDRGPSASRGVRQGDVLALDRKLIPELWAPAVKALVEALRFATVHFGVTAPQLLPSWSMILGLAVALHLKMDPRQIWQWWIRTLLAQSHAQAANTRLIADVDAMSGRSAWPSAGDQIDFVELADRPAKTNGLLARGLASLLVQGGALDPRSADRLSGQERLSIRSIDRVTGAVRRLTGETRISDILVVSESTDRLIKPSVGFPVSELHANALRSQGLDAASLVRSPTFISEAIQVAEKSL